MIVPPRIPVLLSAQLAGRPTGLGVLARVFDSNNAEVPGSPFSLSHVSQGLYTNSAWTPISVGAFIARYEIYTDNTYSVIDPNRDWVIEDISVVRRTSLSDEVDKGH